MKTLSTSPAARLAAVCAGIVLVAVPVALGVDTSGLRSQAAALRADSDSLAAKANAATLELYALEASLGRAQSAVESLTTQREAAARELASARKQVAIARTALRRSEARLGQLVRALYERPGQADPLAILLGASSLDEALSSLDGLERVAGENSRIIERAKITRARLDALAARLAAREADLARLAVEAGSRARALAAATEARKGFVTRLRRQLGSNSLRVASIEAQARTAVERTLSAKPAPVAAPTADVPTPAEAAPPPVTSGARLTVSTTGYALRGRTATGIKTGPGVVAVDPAVIPLGTQLSIPGYGEAIAADTGGAVRGNVIDLWFPTTAEALQWGRRTVTVTIR